MYYIYCIFSVNHKDSYIGHTSNIKRRMANHKQRLKTESQLKIYQFINSIGWNNIQYSILETIESEDRVIARQRERFWIDTITPNLNKCLPCRSQKEYQQDNKEELKFRRNIQNISKRKERTKGSLEYYYNNYERIKQQRIEYRTRNSEKIKNDRAIIFNCGCGSSITSGGKLKHRQSKKHCENLLKNILLMKSKLTYRKKNIDIRI
jgi:predicted GIY-YIG superfamily endonuclease